MGDWTRRDLFKTGVAAVALPGMGFAAQVARNGDAVVRDALPIYFGWTFHLGHANDSRKDFGYGASGELFAKSGGFVDPGQGDFDDSGWQKVDLPHDWAIELPFQQDKVLTSQGSKPLGRGYPETSIGWYRKVFDVAGGAGRRYSLEIAGVFRDCIVVFNGHYLGRNLSGYAPFSFDVTDFVNYGGKNVLVVRADATENEGWVYEGAGIYRHVWLVVTNAVHIPQWGNYVRCTVRPEATRISIASELSNASDTDQDVVVTSTILDPSGSVVGTSSSRASVPAWSQREVRPEVEITAPRLWSIEEPNLYRAATVVKAERGGALLDRYETTFGIRTLHFDADRGFFLNGKRVEMKGTCNHHDHAGVGAALPDRLQYYRIERLKEMGSNAYRTSHNPPTPHLLDAGDGSE